MHSMSFLANIEMLKAQNNIYNDNQSLHTPKIIDSNDMLYIKIKKNSFNMFRLFAFAIFGSPLSNNLLENINQYTGLKNYINHLNINNGEKYVINLNLLEFSDEVIILKILL